MQLSGSGVPAEPTSLSEGLIALDHVCGDS